LHPCPKPEFTVPFNLAGLIRPFHKNSLYFQGPWRIFCIFMQKIRLIDPLSKKQRCTFVNLYTDIRHTGEKTGIIPGSKFIPPFTLSQGGKLRLSTAVEMSVFSSGTWTPH
jgi:hypothetical protein